MKESPMERYKIETRLYWAWQAREECEWLQQMSREGWQFVSWRPMKYFHFRRVDPPEEQEYLVERSGLFYGQIHNQERYLNERAQEGWEFVQVGWGWFFFRRPA